MTEEPIKIHPFDVYLMLQHFEDFSLNGDKWKLPLKFKDNEFEYAGKRYKQTIEVPASEEAKKVIE